MTKTNEAMKKMMELKEVRYLVNGIREEEEETIISLEAEKSDIECAERYIKSAKSQLIGMIKMAKELGMISKDIPTKLLINMLIDLGE